MTTAVVHDGHLPLHSGAASAGKQVFVAARDPGVVLPGQGSDRVDQLRLRVHVHEDRAEHLHGLLKRAGEMADPAYIRTWSEATLRGWRNCSSIKP